MFKNENANAINRYTLLTSIKSENCLIEIRECLSEREIMLAISRTIRESPLAARYVGMGWRYKSLNYKMPTSDMIDKFCKDRPVYIISQDKKSVWVNSTAIVEIGISKDTPDVMGGLIVRDSSGNATGLLYGRAAQEYAGKILGPLLPG